MKSTTATRALLASMAAPALAVISFPIQGREVPLELTKRGLDLLTRRSISLDMLNNATGQVYTAQITVGTPPQTFQLQIDTGSSDMFVVAKTASQCTSAAEQARDGGGCWGGTFDKSASSTFNDSYPGDFSITYGDNTGSQGDYFYDTVGIGGKSLTHQLMGLATETTVGYGLMGVGYDTNEASVQQGIGRYASVVDQLVSEGLITTKAYSLYLDDLDAKTGNILFGGADTGKFIGPLKMLPVAQENGVYKEFNVPLTSISYTLNSGSTSQVTPANYNASYLLDSGTSYTFMPASIVQGLVSAYSAKVSNGQITVPCSAKSTFNKAYITFQFGGASGATINVPMAEWIYPGDGTTCLLKMSATASAPYILGDTFLRSAYIVYDLAHNMVGMAQTNFESTTSNIVEFSNSSNVIPTLTGQTTGTTLSPNAASGVDRVGMSGASVAVMLVGGLCALLGGSMVMF